MESSSRGRKTSPFPLFFPFLFSYFFRKATRNVGLFRWNEENGAREQRESERERIVTRPEKVESPLPRAWFTLVRLALHSLLSRSRERLRDSPGPSGPSICLSGPSFLPRLPVRGPTGSLCLRRRPSFARWHRPRVYSL